MGKLNNNWKSNTVARGSRASSLNLVKKRRKLCMIKTMMSNSKMKLKTKRNTISRVPTANPIAEMKTIILLINFELSKNKQHSLWTNTINILTQAILQTSHTKKVTSRVKCSHLNFIRNIILKVITTIKLEFNSKCRVPPWCSCTHTT